MDNQIFVNDKLDFSGTVIINAENDQRNQIIYGSNSYSTDYSVYVKFNFIEVSESNFKVTLDFTVINYKGEINIGFVEKPTYIFDEETDKIIINIQVKGMSNKLSDIGEKTIDIPRNQQIPIIVNKELIPLNGKQLSLHKEYVDCYNNGVFDSEFYYRDGNFHLKRPQYSEMEMSQSIKDEKNEKFTLAPFRPGIRCRQGNNLAYVL